MAEKSQNHPEITSTLRTVAVPVSLLTVREAAAYLKVKEQTIRSMARRGELPALKVGRSWRFRLEDINSALGK